MSDRKLTSILLSTLGVLSLYVYSKIPPYTEPHFIPYEQWPADWKVCAQGSFWETYGYCLSEHVGITYSNPDYQLFFAEWVRIAEQKKQALREMDR